MTDSEKVTEINSNQEFWKLYLQEHSQFTTRCLHTIGTLISWIVLAIAAWEQIWWLVIVAPIVGYGTAWISHAFVEKNRPLSMKYPVRSFLADYKLTALMLMGRDPGSAPSEQIIDG